MTKIITIIIIVSTVWSVISGIIEKHKKEKLAKQGNLGLKTGQSKPQLQVQTPANLFESRINALRKRPTTGVSSPPQVVVEVTPKHRNENSGDLIKSLHKKDCPLPPKKAVNIRQSRAMAVFNLLKTPSGAKTAIILSEIISKPVSQR
jgi:hypothetical protein